MTAEWDKALTEIEQRAWPAAGLHIRAHITRIEAALRQCADDLQEVGDDYPGSSCQMWCRQKANDARAALAPTPLSTATKEP